MNALDAEIELYLRQNVKKVLKTIKTISILEIYKKNSMPQIVQMVLSHDVKEIDTFSNFQYKELHLEHQSDVRVIRAPIDEDMLIFILRHINDYAGIDVDDNRKEYPRMVAEGKVLIHVTGWLREKL